MRKDHPSTPHGFTLVELLVVIGIIAVLIGLLLPVLSGVAARGRDLKCQANLRSIIQAMHGYAAEHNGSMPWGFVWNRTIPRKWNFSPDNNGEYISWATLVGKYMNRNSTGIATIELDAGFRTTFPLALQCPEADQVREHVVSYAINWLVGVTPYIEFAPTGDTQYLGSLSRPPKRNHLLNETAVLWDTGILVDWLKRPDLRLGCDIDDARMSYRGITTPQLRFYTIKDPFAEYPPGNRGQNHPVQMKVGPGVFYNRDPGTIAAEGGTQWPYQGNLRFRHQKNTTCNVAFADGSVRQFTAKMNPNKTVKSHDALRRYFMIKWPTGVQPHPDYPH